jgi:polyhydroxyalkanoate synthase
MDLAPAAGEADVHAPLTAEQLETVEKLSFNLARAALTAQTAMTEAAVRSAEKPAPYTSDPFHVAPALTEIMTRLAVHPDRLLRAQANLFERYVDLWQTAAGAAWGAANAKPAALVKDKRFADPDWSANPMFDLIKRSYLITSDWLNELVNSVDDVDPVTKRRVAFFTEMMTDALSPSNFLFSNPAALRELLKSDGESLVRGMQNFAADLEQGGGRLAIRQTDASQFVIGENVATAPGKVIFQNDILQLLQFAPTTDTVFETPILIFPPWINKYYILDLRPENSMIRWLTAQGFSVFVVSWVNPDQSLSNKDFSDYLKDGVYAALDAVLRQTGSAHSHAVGYCIGGTLLSCALAHMAARGDGRIVSATFFAAQQDFSAAGDLSLFTSDDWLADVEAKIDQEGGVLSGREMSDTFNILRGNDLIWSYFVNNYLLGKDPRPFDLLFWNSDQTRMPRALHLFYLKNFYRDNLLSKGALDLESVRLDLAKVKTPIYVQSSRDDHISPAVSVYRGAQLFGGPVNFIMAGSGHIAGVINPPAANKYQFWTNAALPPTLEAWRATSQEHPGSWWQNWVDWLKPRSGGEVAARDPSRGPLAPIEDAPGSYVKVKS